MAASSLGEPITRSEILARAQYWVTNAPPGGYDINKSHVGPDGRQYRTDCSGFVSMAWHLANSPTTEGLGSDQLTKAIQKNELQPGDIMNIPISGPAGHVRLFVRWNDPAMNSYHYIDFGSGAKPSEGDSAYPGAKGEHQYQPRRYNNVIDEAANTRVAVVGTGGDMFVKASLWGQWQQHNGGGQVTDVALDGDRVAIVGTCGDMWIKTSLWGGWQQHNGCGQVTDVAMASGAIGIVDNCRSAWVKTSLFGTWEQHTACEQVADIALA